MEFRDKIKKRRLELGKTLDEVAQVIGVSKTTVQRWESGNIQNLRRDKIAKLALALNTTPAYLMGWTESSFQSDNIYAIKNISPMPEMKKIPLLGTIACGVPVLAVENIDEYIEIPKHIRADFALTCQGDSMVGARIMDGDIVYIRSQPDVDNGQIAAVLIEDEATLKRVYKYPNMVILRPENPDYKEMVYQGQELEEIRILGLAVAFSSSIR